MDLPQGGQGIPERAQIQKYMQFNKQRLKARSFSQHKEEETDPYF